MEDEIWAAPRERGWTRGTRTQLAILRGCPARAGMDPNGSAMLIASRRLPRASGDGPETESVSIDGLAAAPRERGWTQKVIDEARTQTGCPARAGMDPKDRDDLEFSERLPRASGDGPWAPCGPLEDALAAPRERGSQRYASF